MRDSMRHFIKIAAALLLLAGAQIALPQSDSAHIRSGAKVFVEKMDGFEDNFVAALHAKQVPVVVVTDNDKAEFFFSGNYNRNGDHVEATVKAAETLGAVRARMRST